MNGLKLLILGCVCSSLIACGEVERPLPAHGEIEDDGSNVAPVEDDDRDYCADFAWYSDGTCDEFCLNPDPDCGRTSDPDPNPSPTQPDPPPVSCPDPNDPNVTYATHDAGECSVIFIVCEEGQEIFYDDACGCGCIGEPTTPPPAECYDDADPAVQRMGDAEECTLIDFACNDGWEYFYDDCGCGCVMATEPCTDDAQCPNGYCDNMAEPGGSDLPVAPAQCVYPNCDDDSEFVCDALAPECGPGLVAAVAAGCWTCLDARTCEYVEG